MCRIIRNHKNLILLFVCGFLIGVFLEIVLIELNKLNLRSKHKSLKQEEVQITCLVLLKHEHMRYVNSSKKTWLKHCQQYYVVDIQRARKPGKKISKLKGGTSCSEAETLDSLMKDYNTCTREYVESEKKWKIVGKSGWSGLCKAIHMTKQNNNHWLIIVPDSLVVLVENLKLFVRDLDCDDGHYFGYVLQNYEADYNVLSAGILLSRGAMKKLFEKFKFEQDCDLYGKYWRNEDLYLGKYLKEMGIIPKDTRDNEGRGRFHGYNLNNVLWPGKLVSQSDYQRKALYPVSQGFNCCSPYLVTMDMSDPDAIQSFYFFLYRLKTVHKELPKSIHPNKTETSFFWKDFLREEGYNESAIENMTSEEYYKIWEKKLPPDVMYREMRNFLKNSKDKI